MASDQKTADYIVEQLSKAGEISTRKMFGEYALYCNGKVVAFICDNQLFVKPTKGGREFLKHPKEAPPYPGAKLYFLIEGDQWEDRDWLTQLISLTEAEVPVKKKR